MDGNYTVKTGYQAIMTWGRFLTQMWQRLYQSKVISSKKGSCVTLYARDVKTKWKPLTMYF
ncbi:hypothetical protein TSUD_323940 [Trifolium subterraneum]|uniref:Uncharacterized protein n=1 Tax=Trifolium subterraneum TaxID=3900 RepID=A0A2Z6NYP8_TRISU|nr:hypothetical protein TSUD_323940 [Trifolium subterraneum]